MNTGNTAESPNPVLVLRSTKPSPLAKTSASSLYSLIGLPLLYASAYFLGPLRASGAYFLPSSDIFGLVIRPCLETVAIGSVAVYLVSSAARWWLSPKVATYGAVVVLALLTLIGVKGIMNAAGYDWQDRLPPGRNVVTALRDFKIVSFAVALSLVWMARGALPVLARILGSLGFALAALSAIRLVLILSSSPHIAPTSAADAAFGTQPNAELTRGGATLGGSPTGTAAAGSDVVPAGARPRRVVWVIFDETDFGRVFGSDGLAPPPMPNFRKLADSAIFATDANSPASATLFSIPALLTGVPIVGDGIRIDDSGTLYVEGKDSRMVRFDAAHSLFGAVAAMGRTASVLGFLHPYCKLFKLDRCDSFSWPQVGHLDDALLANVPDFIVAKLKRGDYWESITRDSLRLLPEYLARDDALTFIHLNLPHPPAGYADKLLELQPSSDPLAEYAHNLLLTDAVLGRIVGELQAQNGRDDVLLVVSTDHWLRNMWYRANQLDASRPVPFLVWHVGETRQIHISQALSTVNTAAMILRYLHGDLGTQTDIAQWWVEQPVYPTYIVPNI